MTIAEIEKTIPRSDEYLDKMTVEFGIILINGTQYFKRIFSDGCAELIRYDYRINRWMISCFTNIDEPEVEQL